MSSPLYHESDYDGSQAATTSSTQLTQDQLSLIENKRKRALEIRKAKEETSSKMFYFYARISNFLTQGWAKLADNFKEKKLIDTGAGFYLDEEDLIQEQNIKIKELPPVPPRDEHLLCDNCNKRFPHSFLSINFNLTICDSCKLADPEEYELITRTDAKAEFLLKDCDFDYREPPLKYMLKKNPHHQKWGEMKLYLKFQCRDRAMLVHENEEKLEEKKEVKILNLHKTRQKNYEKKIKVLRKETRTVTKKVAKAHQHEYGEELYDKKKDVNYKICKTCSYRHEYEEL